MTNLLAAFKAMAEKAIAGDLVLAGEHERANH